MSDIGEFYDMHEGRSVGVAFVFLAPKKAIETVTHLSHFCHTAFLCLIPRHAIFAHEKLKFRPNYL